MTESGREREPEVDALVRAHLQRQAEAVDAAAVLARVKARRAAAVPPPRRSLGRSVLWFVVAAAAVVAAFFLGGWWLTPAQASAETIVRQAREAHALPRDRCYAVQVVPDPNGVLADRPLLFHPREMRLWTRGDRFWMESTNPERQWAVGRDEQGVIWAAVGRGHGVRYDPEEETPPALAVACDVCSLQVETLLDRLIADFDLRREGPRDGAYRIEALPRAGGGLPWLRSAELEIDAETRVLRRLVLHRTRNGQPLATVTFTLTDAGSQPDGAYELEGHLDPGAPVYTGTNGPMRRAVLLRSLFGPAVGRPVP